MELLPGKSISALWVLPHIAFSFLNLPYIYGGKSALVGLDCSGLACEILGALGLIPRNSEFGSQQLYDKFKDSSSDGVSAIGSLAFYGKDTSHIDHVGIFLDTFFIIEAAHGDSTTLTVELAKSKNAKTRVSPYNYRKDLVAVLRPKYEDFGLHD